MTKGVSSGSGGGSAIAQNAMQVLPEPHTVVRAVTAPLRECDGPAGAITYAIAVAISHAVHDSYLMTYYKHVYGRICYKYIMHTAAFQSARLQVGFEVARAINTMVGFEPVQRLPDADERRAVIKAVHQSVLSADAACASTRGLITPSNPSKPDDGTRVHRGILRHVVKLLDHGLKHAAEMCTEILAEEMTMTSGSESDGDGGDGSGGAAGPSRDTPSKKVRFHDQGAATAPPLPPPVNVQALHDAKTKTKLHHVLLRLCYEVSVAKNKPSDGGPRSIPEVVMRHIANVVVREENQPSDGEPPQGVMASLWDPHFDVLVSNKLLMRVTEKAIPCIRFTEQGLRMVTNAPLLSDIDLLLKAHDDLKMNTVSAPPVPPTRRDIFYWAVVATRKPYFLERQASLLGGEENAQRVKDMISDYV